VNAIDALTKFRYKKHWQALHGGKGAKQNLFGKNADHLYIEVPLGTHVHDFSTNEIIEINTLNEPVLIAQGGKGGRGNNEFKTATLQTPKFAENGGIGEEKKLRLELRLIADVGFIGLPNAGKSSLLQVLTNAQPKIGNYAFTTLEPNLGMLGEITLADIPGLIEGASEGKGLGIKFLRHIEKTKLLVHCIDSTTEDMLKAYTIVRDEFKAYKHALLEKQEIIVLTKVDLVTATQLKEKQKQLQSLDKAIITVSVYDEASVSALEKNIKETVATS
jgi:GTP-binding protein